MNDQSPDAHGTGEADPQEIDPIHVDGLVRAGVPIWLRVPDPSVQVDTPMTDAALLPGTGSTARRWLPGCARRDTGSSLSRCMRPPMGGSSDTQDRIAFTESQDHTGSLGALSPETTVNLSSDLDTRFLRA